MGKLPDMINKQEIKTNTVKVNKIRTTITAKDARESVLQAELGVTMNQLLSADTPELCSVTTTVNTPMSEPFKE